MLEDVHAHADAREQFRGANLARAEPAILVSIDEQPRALSGRNLEHRSKSCAVGHAIIGKELERQHGYAASELLLVCRANSIEVEHGEQPRARLALDEVPPCALVEQCGQAFRLALVKEQILGETAVRAEPAERKAVLRAQRDEDSRVRNGIGESSCNHSDVARARMRERFGRNQQRRRANLFAKRTDFAREMRCGVAEDRVGGHGCRYRSAEILSRESVRRKVFPRVRHTSETRKHRFLQRSCARFRKADVEHNAAHCTAPCETKRYFASRSTSDCASAPTSPATCS